MMESLESVLSEEWLLSNVLSATDLYDTDVPGVEILGDGVTGHESVPWKRDDQALFSKHSFTTNDALIDSGIGSDADSFNLSWLDETVCISSLEASLSGTGSSLPADLSPILADQPVTAYQTVELKPSHSEPLVTYVQPSTIDVSGLYAQSSHIVMDDTTDMNVLHLPETVLSDPETAMMIVDALSNQDLVADSLSVDDVESILSSPPSSPGDASVVPYSPPSSNMASPRVPERALTPESPVDYEDDDDVEYVPRSRKRKAAESSRRNAKAPKILDKKERKKYQNRNAATKYRLKKQAEVDEQKSEFTQLETRNRQLKKQVESISSEIGYMKQLLNEVLRKKGLRIM